MVVKGKHDCWCSTRDKKRLGLSVRKAFASINPATGEGIARVPLGDGEEVAWYTRPGIFGGEG